MQPTATICLTCIPPEPLQQSIHTYPGAAVALMVIGVTLLMLAGMLVRKWHRATQ